MQNFASLKVRAIKIAWSQTWLGQIQARNSDGLGTKNTCGVQGIVPHTAAGIIKVANPTCRIPDTPKSLPDPSLARSSDPSLKIKETEWYTTNKHKGVRSATMYDFHDSTDIFLNPSFLQFFTQKAP